MLSSSPTLFASGLTPQGLVFDKAGNLYEADAGSGNIYEFTNANGTLSTNKTILASGLKNPWGLTFNNAGDLLVANCLYDETQEGYITEISPTGTQTNYATVESPNELALNTAGDLFVTSGNYGRRGIVVITADGTPKYLGSGFGNPVGLAFYPAPQLLAGRYQWHLSSDCFQSILLLFDHHPSFNRHG